MDWLDLLAVQGTLNSLLQHHSSKAPILRLSAFFTVQLQVYAPTSNAEETEVEWFYEDLQDLLELTLKKKMSFSL